MTANLKKQLGNLAEQKACDFLQTQGLILLMRNYHCMTGEIDLIMREGEDIVFIEVRSRATSCYGSAVESVNKTKQKKLIKSALLYLKNQHWLNKVGFRFDIIGVSGSKIDWIKNAFSAENCYT